MKKILCIVLAAIVLFTTPIRGYSAGVSLPFGIGEEIILPFLLSLLGVKAAESVDTYNDLVTYNEKIKGSLLEKVAGLAGMEQVQEWLFNVVNGVIDTDSIIWKKLYEIALSNYVVTVSGNTIPSSNPLGLTEFTFTFLSANSIVTSTGTYRGTEDCSFVWSKINNFYSPLFASSSSTFIGQSYRSYSQTWSNLSSRSYTYDDRTVYYYFNASGSATAEYNPAIFNDNSSLAESAWLMVYGDYITTSENIGSYSTAFDNVLSSSEKDDIVDGTSVIQLYNPAELQNGLEIIPGGDPEDDPNLKKIPFAVTADWWNFFQVRIIFRISTRNYFKSIL